MEALQPIRRVLSRKALRLRLGRLGLDLTAILTVIGLFLALGVAIVGLPAAPLALLFLWSVLLWAICLTMFLRAVRSQVRPLDQVSLALRLEALAGGMHSELASALELGRKGRAVTDGEGISWPLVEALAHKVRNEASRIEAIPLGDRRPGSRAAMLILVGVSVGALGMGAPQWFARAWSVAVAPWSVSPWARQSLVLEPGSTTVTEGATVRVTVRGRGQGRDPVVLEVRRPGGAPPERLPMETAMPGVWTHALAANIPSFDYRATGRRAVTAWYTVTVLPVPRVGDIALSVTPPAYTGLPATISEGSGNLRCLPGSLVRWSARCTVEGASVALEMGDGRTVPLRAGPDGRLSGEFTVVAGGRYRVTAKVPSGSPAKPDEYDIVLLQDDLPAVELTLPGEDLELDRAAMLEVHYTGRDDFGITSGGVIWRSDDGRQGRVPLADGGGRRALSGSTGWDLAELGLAAGRSVWFQVELKDNDTISGPKAGLSAGRVIRIRDDREMHKDIEDDEKELRRELTDLLGDELEIAADMDDLSGRMEQETEERHDEGLEALGERQSSATRKFERSMEKLDRLLDARARDSFSDPAALYMKVLARQMLSAALEGERREEEHLGDLRRTEELQEADRAREMRWMEEQKERRIGSMEQALNLLDESNRQQNMEQALGQQERMADTQRDLVDMLEKMKDGIPAAEAAQMRRMLDEIARSLQGLMDALSSMQGELPEEFVNADALKTMDMKDLMGDLTRLAEALKSGDLDAARKAAESLLKGMNDLLERLKAAAAEQRRTSRAGMEDFSRKRTGEFDQLVKRQRDLLQRTETIEREARSRRETERGRGEREREEPAGTEGPPRAPVAETLNQEERDALDRLAGEQQGARTTAEKLAGEVESMAAALPLIPQELAVALREAAGFMDGASGNLAGHAPEKAVPDQREALYRLMQAQNAAAQAAAQMGRMSGLMSGGETAGEEAGALFGLIPGMSSSGGRNRRDGGRMGISVRNFRIPGSQEYQTPREFREELMESMKAGYPKDFEKAIREYFRSIAE